MQIFVELSLILVIAGAIGGVMRLLKQPLIIGHIITGLLVGPHALGLATSVETLETFSRFGISILLFIVGLGLSPKVIKQTGKIAVITGLGQVVFTTFFGFLIAKLFGYTSTAAIFIAIALTFSSTIIILKLLTDKQDLSKLYGRIAVGFLLVQDIVATIILVVVGTTTSGENAILTVGLTLLKGIIVIALLGYVSIKWLPKLEDFVANSQELLFLFALSWGLGLATILEAVGFSIEIGALVAGILLAITPYAEETAAKLKPLRDFFIIMFFVLLGIEMNLGLIGDILPQALVFSIFVLVGNPFIVLVLMGLLNYNHRTSFRAGLTVAQISEFSLILILLATNLGYVDEKVMSLVTIVGLITIAGSTYLIMYEEKIYPFLKGFLQIFEKKKSIQPSDDKQVYDVVLFGANRVGYDFMEIFKKLNERFLVVDYDPDKIKNLQSRNINCIYGDAEDTEFVDELGIENAKMVVSTIPDFDVNSFLIKRAHAIQVRNLKKQEQEITSITTKETHAKNVEHINKPIVIVISYDPKQAIKLYEMGASYVILPHFISGYFTSILTQKHGFNLEKFDEERANHIKYLKQRSDYGHKHPSHI